MWHILVLLRCKVLAKVYLGSVSPHNFTERRPSTVISGFLSKLWGPGILLVNGFP